jgi:N-acetylglucosaminyldiphosphoundecaprenol N-acetyl-beta-D-mannosaminyltransferase
MCAEIAENLQILGIRFFRGTAAEAVAAGLSGGLVVVPAAPALLELERNVAYREALLDADLVITDSGLMVLLWWVLKREKVIRVSGLEYLKILLEEPRFHKTGVVLWVMPSAYAEEKLLKWLHSADLPCSLDDCYLAPRYLEGTLNDPDLIAQIQRRRPAHIIIGLGGGVQERLGHFLKHHLDYRPGIHCVGAAIGFLSGEQVNIPSWADRLFLGWLFRCLQEPRKFAPRYWRARRLIRLMWRHGANLPPLANGRE